MTQPQPFITYLEGLREDRGALAALRRGLGQPPGDAREMYPYVVRWLPAEPSARREAAYYLVAASSPITPTPAGAATWGRHFAEHWIRTATTQPPSGASPRCSPRIQTTCHSICGRRSASFKSKDVPVDWHQLFADVLGWGNPPVTCKSNGRALSGAARPTKTRPNPRRHNPCTSNCT